MKCHDSNSAATPGVDRADGSRRTPDRYFRIRFHDAAAIFLRYLPVTLVSASVPLVGIVDAAVISTLGDASLIGGIAAAATVMNFMFFTLYFLRTSTTALVAQATGAGDDAEVLAVLLRAALLALMFGGAAVVLQAPIATAGLAALGIEGAVAAAAEAYFGIRIWSVPAMLFNFTVIGWLLGRGLIVRAMMLQAMTSLLSIVFCVLAVMRLNLGVRGVASASMAAEPTTASVGAVLVIAAVRRGRDHGLAGRVVDPPKVRRVLTVNANLLIRSMTVFFVMAWSTRESAALGTETLAINAVLINVFYISATLMDGSAVAAQQLAGSAVGAHSVKRFREAAGLTLLLGTGLALCIALALMLMRPWLIPALVAIDAVRDGAREYFLWPVVAQLIGAIAFVCDGLFIGATWTREARNLMLFAAGAFLVAWAVLVPIFGSHGLWSALVIFLASRSVAYLWSLRRLVPQTFGIPSA